MDKQTHNSGQNYMLIRHKKFPIYFPVNELVLFAIQKYIPKFTADTIFNT
jgi:hypothetical protein